MAENIILVDKNGNEIGIEEKIKAHREGKLHKAFSIFVFDSKGRLLLQRRAESKYHCGGLWANTCCSHPRPGESPHDAVHRRLKEEMGFDCELKEAFRFIYKAEFENGLTEYELDHVFIGDFDAEPSINMGEVSEFKWIDMRNLRKDISRNPEKYTPWFRIALGKIKL